MFTILQNIFPYNMPSEQVGGPMCYKSRAFFFLDHMSAGCKNTRISHSFPTIPEIYFIFTLDHVRPRVAKT